MTNNSTKKKSAFTKPDLYEYGVRLKKKNKVYLAALDHMSLQASGKTSADALKNLEKTFSQHIELAVEIGEEDNIPKPQKMDFLFEPKDPLKPFILKSTIVLGVVIIILTLSSVFFSHSLDKVSSKLQKTNATQVIDRKLTEENIETLSTQVKSIVQGIKPVLEELRPAIKALTEDTDTSPE